MAGGYCTLAEALELSPAQLVAIARLYAERNTRTIYMHALGTRAGMSDAKGWDKFSEIIDE